MKIKFTLIMTLLSLVILGACTYEKDNIIVNQELLDIESSYSNNVETYRMQYLSDDFKVVGFIVKPKTIEDKAPLLIFNRGGNREFGVINEKTLQYLSFWADQGYVVLASQYRGNDGGEGQEELGGSDINDVLNLIHVAEELPYVDMDQKVMLGASRGGMMTYLAIKHDLDIQAAAVISGVTDQLDLYEKRNDMKLILNELVGDPILDREEYEKRSAVYWADEIDVPTLILHGEKDWRVPVDQARNMVDQLKKYQKDYKYIEYPYGDHSLSAYSDEYKKEIIDWFELYLNK
ncbi:alpha/beta hydrolase family protein [Chengkuizengella marina]|uniref:S9 family peptidase n=1 Tax=Chengkuizengella marina TaxID=2507566 RepID=A0A6N9PYF1_9BACL|nr:prolyl oligopeptidase family serine peptidase [Chengkuizengella marina]NBI27842.1 S9 family peptidase [Chengkuizengella marina]